MNIKIYLSFLLFALFFACTHKDSLVDIEAQEKALHTLKGVLDSAQTIQREEPFILRRFNPNLNGKWIGNAVSYGCYRKGQHPGQKGPSKEEIIQDLDIISEYWNLVRVYNADDDTEHILEVIREKDFPIKMMLGVWLAKENDDAGQKQRNIENVLRAISLSYAYKDIIIAINVGNETQVDWSGHRMQKENLLRYIRAVRQNVSVPVTTADDYNFWNKENSRDVAVEIDFIATHIHPVWNGKTLQNAIAWQDSTFKDLQKRHPERQIILAETGWATDYNADKNGPGEEGTLVKGAIGLAAQEKYLVDLKQWISKNKITTFLFEAFDEPWKGGGDNSAANDMEKHWGVFYENRTAKESFKNYLEYSKNNPDYRP